MDGSSSLICPYNQVTQMNYVSTSEAKTKVCDTTNFTSFTKMEKTMGKTLSVVHDTLNMPSSVRTDGESSFLTPFGVWAEDISLSEQDCDYRIGVSRHGVFCLKIILRGNSDKYKQRV